MYKSFLNSIANLAIKKAPNIPDYHLMVGTAERHESLPVMVYKNSRIPGSLVKNMQEIQTNDNETVQRMIADGNLEVNDLNWNIALLGNGLGV